MRAFLSLLLSALILSRAWAQLPTEPSVYLLVQQLSQPSEPLPALPIKEARRTLTQARQRYQKGLPIGATFYLTARVLNEAATPEPVVVLVDNWQGRHITGRIVRTAGAGLTRASAPADFDEAAVLDWILLRPDGAEEGNYLGKFLELEQRLTTMED